MYWYVTPVSKIFWLEADSARTTSSPSLTKSTATFSVPRYVVPTIISVVPLQKLTLRQNKAQEEAGKAVDKAQAETGKAADKAQTEAGKAADKADAKVNGQ